MSYGTLERGIARFLDSTPRLRGWLKQGYQRLNYLAHAQRGAGASLHPQVRIERVGAGGGQQSQHEHFFGYFGISPWTRDGARYVVHRWNGSEPAAQVCIRGLASDELRVIATTRAWNFQQGSMAQWLDTPGAQSLVFNDVVERQLVCRVIDADGAEHSFPWPIQALRPGGQEALSINYRRLARLRAEYGYDVEVENFSPDMPLDHDGLWLLEFSGRRARLIISLEQLTRFQPASGMAVAQHKVNHALYSPSGARFVFMHRWFEKRGKYSRLYCAAADGSQLRLLLDDRMVSHYAWRDDETLLVWARTAEHGDHYYLLDVGGGERKMCGVGLIDRRGDGHPSFSPDGRWIITDTYPDRARLRRLVLFEPGSSRCIEVGSFFAPWRYDGAVRCDLHPRWSPDGRSISIDSAHEGVRANYILDVARLVG